MAQLKEKWTGRGKATIFEDDSIEFRPDGKGQPVQRDVRKSGRSKFYQTKRRDCLYISTRRSTGYASSRRSCSTLTRTPTALPTGHTL